MRRPRAAAGTRAARSAALRLPGAATVSPKGSQNERTDAKLFVRPLCLCAFVVWSVLDMAAVAERFILRSSAPAEGDAVSGLVQFAVR
jgi:hypothetical protein